MRGKTGQPAVPKKDCRKIIEALTLQFKHEGGAQRRSAGPGGTEVAFFLKGSSWKLAERGGWHARRNSPHGT